MSEKKAHPTIIELCKQVTAKRAKTVIDHILVHGYITTEEIQSTYGYDHPPRAVRDVRENGIPLETFKVTSARTGRKIGAYRFGDPAKIRRGRIGGRQAFSKQFKEALIAKYGSADAITGEKLDSGFLQIDHRIPYGVAGDESYDESNLDAYMLLDASSQRAKSWTCEHCDNFTDLQDPKVCEGCYWAFPEAYTHVAMQPVRRAELLWAGEEAKVYEALQAMAAQQGVPVTQLVKRLVREAINSK